MRPQDLWPKHARIIEVGATCGDIARRLIEAGYDKILAIAPNERRRRTLADRQPELRRRVVAANSSRVVSQNNAEVLILSGWSALSLIRYRAIRHANYAAIRFQWVPLCWLATLCGLVQCVTGRLAWPRIVNCGVPGTGPWLLVFRNRWPRPYLGVRRFVPHELGVCGLLYGLQTSGIGHAVLRWFETLPHVGPGEDLDILVEDEGLDSIRRMFDDGPGVQPVDIYSVTGLPGSDFRGMPYFPPYLAEELLERSVIYKSMCRVPAPREHFLSLAYHALYHKGHDSGIPATGAAKSKSRAVDHDYAAILNRQAAGLGIHVAATLEDLDACLDANGWRPPHDMLIRLSRRNRWIRSLLRRPEQRGTADDRIAVFLLREEALRRGGVERAVELIEACGFQIVTTRKLDAATSRTVARSLRGGNWGRGPWPVSGGRPVAAIIAYDPAPIAPTRRDRKRFPFIANARLLCKEQLRDAFNEGLPKDQHCNVIHSSDNGREAMDYLRIIMPDEFGAVLAGIGNEPLARAA